MASDRPTFPALGCAADEVPALPMFNSGGITSTNIASGMGISGRNLSSVHNESNSQLKGSSRCAELTGFKELLDFLGDQVAHARGGDGPLASRQLRRANAALEDFFDGSLDRLRDRLHTEGITKHHGYGSDGAYRIGAIATGNVGRRSVHRL